MIEIREYKGHIVNWRNLCDELGLSRELSREKREYEIIRCGYEKWGHEIGDHLYGMFAFCLYDDSNDEIFCIRDHFGTKPFYYYVTEDRRLLCSTMIRNIMEKDGFVKELNRNMLQIYMSLTYVAGEDTFFKGVKKLMPGRWLSFIDGQIKICRYWKPEFHPDNSKNN